MEDTLRAAVTSIVVKARPKKVAKELATSDGLHTAGKVLVLTTEDLFRNILGVPNTLIVLNFYNHEKISQDMRAPFAKCAADHLGVIFASIDVNACKNSIRACVGATRLPAFRFFRNGDRLKEWMGKDPEYLEGLVKQYNK